MAKTRRKTMRKGKGSFDVVLRRGKRTKVDLNKHEFQSQLPSPLDLVNLRKPQLKVKQNSLRCPMEITSFGNVHSVLWFIW